MNNSTMLRALQHTLRALKILEISLFPALGAEAHIELKDQFDAIETLINENGGAAT